MPALFDRLRVAARLPRRLRHAAWSAALPHADAVELEALAAEVLDALVDDPAGDLAPDLLRRWGDLSLRARETAVSVLGVGLTGAMDRLIESSPGAAWGAAADLVRVRPREDVRAAIFAWVGEHALLAGPMDEDARAVLVAAVHAAETGAHRASLDRPLAAAADRYADHRDGALLEAVACELASPGPALARWLDGADHADLLPLRSAIRRRLAAEPGPGLAIGLLARTGLEAPVADWLASGAHAEAWPGLLERGHLLGVRDRRRALRRRPGLIGRLRALPCVDSLPDGAQRGLVRWIDASSADPSARAETLGDLITLPDPGARLMAARALASSSSGSSVDEALLEFALDDDARVGVVAAAALCDSPSAVRLRSNERAIGLMRRSPLAPVREIARSAGERLARDRAPDDPGAIRSMPTALWALRRDRAGCLSALERVMASGAPEARAMALEFARRHGLGRELDAGVLRAAARDADPYVAARAVSLLGAVDGASFDLAAAIGHPNRRVAANAVEALGRRREPPDLAPYAEDPAPRVRANAVRAMLDHDGQRSAGHAALGAMLSDPRPEHRLSGVWAAQRGRAVSLAEPIGALATRDLDARVRRRALRCAVRLLAGPGPSAPGRGELRRAS